MVYLSVQMAGFADLNRSGIDSQVFRPMRTAFLAPGLVVAPATLAPLVLTFGAPPKQPRPGWGSGQERRRYKAKSALTRHQSLDTNRTKMKVQTD